MTWIVHTVLKHNLLNPDHNDKDDSDTQIILSHSLKYTKETHIDSWQIHPHKKSNCRFYICTICNLAYILVKKNNKVVGAFYERPITCDRCIMEKALE